MKQFENEPYLSHYGMPRRSGRYPWGSGKDPYQHSRDFIGRVEELRKRNFTYTDKDGKVWTGDTAIAKSMNLSTTDFRTELGLAKSERRMLDVETAKRLRDKEGLGNSEIGRKMGISESTVRSLLNSKSEDRMMEARKTADFLKEQIKQKGMLDVGAEVYRELGVSSKEKFDQALYLLKREGYEVYGGGVPQATNPGKQTNLKVLCPPGTQHSEIYDFDKIHSVTDYVSHDGGETFDKFVYPKSMDSKRLQIRYAEDGGIDKDGIVELRRGVDDLSLGESRYAQVRILVDGKKYIKGMAVYSDNMPDGVDVVFNTNKTKDKSKMDVLKDIKNDPDNPFGSLIKAGGQSYYVDKNGERQLSLINKRADEGDWTDWKDALPSQFLGKQSLALAKKQLNLAKVDKLAEYDDICSLNNPTIKKHLLSKFADGCDSAAVHLQAAALPGQKYHVIIPINTLSDKEVYAPNYKDGTKVALVRYPHGGTFEIPILTVNNKHAAARKILGTDVIDAVGINKNIADRLSGADFDGDTVMVIPTHDRAGKVKITSTHALKGLEGFDPKTAYPERKGMKYMKDPVTGKDSTQMQMGVISNLITDMTLGGAKEDELARAVRHSMVVIDAGKHKLDYKQSEIDNNIAALKKKYQRTVDADGTEHVGGASTLLSRSKGEYPVLKRQGSPKINTRLKSNGEPNPDYDPSKPEGSLLWKTADDVAYEVSKVNARTGKVSTTTKYRTQKSTKMAETDDANTLVSNARYPMELLYADYANSMKSLANRARKEMVSTGKIKYDKTAAENYKQEVDSLKSKLNTALLNKGRERAAQRMTYVDVEAKIKAAKEAGTEMKRGDIKKAKQQALTKYRSEVGSVSRKNRSIDITDKEWEAIQAGAISENKLKQILDNTDIDKLRERATPKTSSALSQAKINKIKSMRLSNYTIAQIADQLGISTSVVSKYLK
jgi:DNA-binding CsgD family transcriptional regulator